LIDAETAEPPVEADVKTAGAEMNIMRGADAILDTLEEVDSELVVGYIGHTTQEIADALNERDTMRSIYPATELGGAHLINGYNIVRGRGAAVGIWHTCGTLMIPMALYEGLFTDPLAAPGDERGRQLRRPGIDAGDAER